MKNHFLIVGAQRSGTTYLYNILEEHPQICMAKPVKPEPKYFIGKEEDDINYDEYINSFFAHCNTKAKIFGEKSTSYYERRESAQLISTLIPEGKIIFLLRNPVERALSNYFFSVNNGLEKRTLKEVFIENKTIIDNNFNNISVDPFNYLGRGDYSKFIKSYLDNFSNRQIKILIFEEFVGDIHKIQDLYTFLKIDNQYIPNNINRIINSSNKKNEIPIEVINKLNDHYKKPIKNLEQLLNIDLTIWK